MFCTNCGNKLNDTDAFCSSCGTKVYAKTVNSAINYNNTANNATQASPIRRMISNKCEACGATINEISKGHFLCEYCGSEYITVNNGEITESKITEKEILDVFYEAARYETNNMFYEELQCLLKIIDKAPDNTVLLCKLGRAYRRNNMHAKAIECYEKSIQINPSYANAYTNLGTIYVLYNQFAKAETYCKKAITLMNNNRIHYTNDDYAVAHSNCAIAVGKQGKIKEAKALLEIAESNGYKNGAQVRKMIGIRKGLFG